MRCNMCLCMCARNMRVRTQNGEEIIVQLVPDDKSNDEMEQVWRRQSQQMCSESVCARRLSVWWLIQRCNE
jgi:hypothetical protein